MRNAARLREKAAACREFAGRAGDSVTRANLLSLALEYEAEARKAESPPEAQPPTPIVE